MGWKTSLILADDPSGRPADELLAALGFGPCRAGATVPLESVFDPAALYLGRVRGLVLVLDPGLPGRLVEDRDPGARAHLAAAFPAGRAIAAVLHSVVNLYGWVRFRDGVPIRRRWGSADSGLVVDTGEPSLREAAFMDRYSPGTRQGEDGRDEAIWVDRKGEEWTHDQLGEDLVFEALAELLGERPDLDDELLAGTRVTRYDPPGLLARLGAWLGLRT